MALTKTERALFACAEVAQNAIAEGGAVDISDMYDVSVDIKIALTDATAHTGTLLLLQTTKDASGDEGWVTQYKFVGPTGTGNTEVITNNPAAIGTTVLTCASTTGYEMTTKYADERWRFLEDVDTFANSEWFEQVAVSSNTSVTARDGTTRAHAVNSIMHNIALTYHRLVDANAKRIRLIVDNTYDADGATVAVKADIMGKTAL